MSIHKILFKFFLVYCFILSVTCVTTQAAESKPSMPKNIEICSGAKEPININSNGWIIESIKIKSSKKSVAYARVVDWTVVIEGKSEGKATITASVKAKKGKKLKTFKLKTKVNVVNSMTPISFEELYNANTHDAIFARHSNYVEQFFALNPDVAKLIGFWKINRFCTASDIFDSSTTYNSKYTDNMLVKDRYFTDTEEYVRKYYEGDPVICYLWMTMSDSAQKELKEAFNFYPSSKHIISFDNSDEHTISVSKVDNELYITTSYTDKFIEKYNSDTVETVYIVDAATLDLHKADAYYVDGAKRYHFVSQYITYDTTNPLQVDDFIKAAEYHRTQNFTNPRTLTVIYDSGETYSCISDESEFVSVQFKDGYDLYFDSEGKERVDYIPAEGDVTMYALKL